MSPETLRSIVRESDFLRYRNPSHWLPPDDPRGIEVAVFSNVSVIYYPRSISIFTHEDNHRREYILSFESDWRRLSYSTLISRLSVLPFLLAPPVLPASPLPAATSSV